MFAPKPGMERWACLACKQQRICKQPARMTGSRGEAPKVRVNAPT
jgi:hypothetical protein